MKKLFQFSMLLLIVLQIGCSEDSFELERPPEEPWNTLDEFERVPIALYASLYSGDKWNIPYANYAMFKVSAGDDIAYVSDPSWGYFRDTEQNNSWSKANFQLLYRTIGTANDALNFVAENGGNPYPTESADDIVNNFNRILGEIYFCRAMAYYYLQTFYGNAYAPNGGNSSLDLPLRTSFATTVDEANNPEIGSTQQIFDLILSDFQRAFDLLPEEYINNTHPQSYEVRATKFAAAAMLMKTHFTRGEYSRALDLANFIIDNNEGRFDLSEDPIEAFNKNGTVRGREVIFFAPYYDITLPAPHHLSVLNNTYENGNMCQWAETRMSLSALQKLNWIEDVENSTDFNQLANKDKRFQQLMAVRYPESTARGDQLVDSRPEINQELTLWPFKYYRNGNSFFTNIPLIRLAEILMTRSILRFNAGDLSGAADDLNTVRKRSWDETLMPFVPISASEISAEIIHTERMVEMFNEPDRVEYFRALKMDIPPGDRENASPEPYDSKKFVWTIPAEERAFNNSLD